MSPMRPDSYCYIFICLLLFFLEFRKSTKNVSEVLKNVASSESNLKLQKILFQCSSRYEHIGKPSMQASACGDLTHAYAY